MMESEGYTPAPGKILYSGGKWLVPENERPADWREREQPKAVKPPAEKVAWSDLSPATFTVKPMLPVRRTKAPESLPEGFKRSRESSKYQPRMFKFTAADCVARFEAGEMPKDVAEAYGCSIDLVRRKLREAGVPLPSRKLPRVKITPAEIVARCNAGEMMPQIAKEFNCHESLLYRRRLKASAHLGPRMCARCGEPTKKATQAKYCAPCAEASMQENYERANIRRQAERHGETA